MEYINSIEELFKTYLFTKELLLVLVYVFFGAMLTAFINNAAIKKQAKFNYQYEILKRELSKVTELSKEIEVLEINLSFSKNDIGTFVEDIEIVNSKLLRLNESLRENRKFVRKYIIAKSVEHSAQMVSDFMKLMYDQRKGFMSFEVITSFDGNTLDKLRILNSDSKVLENQLSESLEKLISPGLVSKFMRKVRKPVMFFEELVAIWLVSRKR